MTLLNSESVKLATMGFDTSVSEKSENRVHYKVEEKSTEIEEPYKNVYLWDRIIAFSLLHIVGAYAIFLTLTSWRHFTLFLFHYFTTGNFVNLGITMGAHRLWAHRSFKATLPIKIFLLIAQAMAGQNSLFVWVRDHRTHHKFSDTDADPHNASRGFFFSHMGWLLMKKHPEVKRKGKAIDMSDLTSDSWVMLQYKYFFAIFIITNILGVYVSLLIGYTLTESIMIGFILRYVLTLHFTWSVNSVAHFFGSKPYTRNIKPVESGLVSFLTKGEGWHNYHHTFPWDYKAGEFGNKNNFTCQVIELCAKLGLVYDLKNATREMVKNRVIRHGDGTHEIVKKDC